jgi:20S proteasome alpha/beta subunit
MTTVVGIKTPDGVVLASDLLKVRWESNGRKDKIMHTEEGFRKIYPTADGRALLACAYQIHPGYAHLFLGRMEEVLKTCPAEELPTRLRDRISTVLMASDLEHHMATLRGGTEFEALMAYASGKTVQLGYQYSCHPVNPVGGFAAIGSGKQYALKKLRNCRSVEGAAVVAEQAIVAGCRRDKFSKGLNIMALTKRGIREVKFSKS